MKKHDLNINQNIFTKKVKFFQSKRLIQNPKKLLRKRQAEKKANYTSLYLNQSSPYYNNTTQSKFYIKKGISNKDFKTEKTSSPIRTTFSKLNMYKIKMNNRLRPMSSSIRKLPKLINSNNSSLIFNPNSQMICLEEEKLNQEKFQLNKLVRFLSKQLNKLKKENEKKDIMINNEEKELNDIIYKNKLTDEEKDLNSIILNYQNINISDNEESEIYNNQSYSAYSLIQKIKNQIKNFNEQILQEDEKIKIFKSSIIYTKLKEINMENDLIQIHMKKIESLLNNSLNLKEANDKKLKEIPSFEYNINIQKELLEELAYKKELLDNEEKNLKNNIKVIEANIDFMKKQVLKNTKELDTLRLKNKNLLKDKVINSKIIINNEEETNQTLKGFYNAKILKLKKDIHFYKTKDIHDEEIKTKLKEQRMRLIESIKQVKNINLPTSMLSLKSNNLEGQPEKQTVEENKKEIIIEENELDEEKIEKLKKVYKKERTYEKKLENKYREIQEKFRTIYNTYKEQNKNQESNNNLEENNIESTNANNNNINQNEVEFGIDKNNPFYTEEEKNNPEIELKFNSSQYNQFTYILFKNFESKGIVPDESYNKIINPFVEFANQKKLKTLKYPSPEFDLIIEEFTKIILEALNSDNKYNHTLTKIFLGALLINSGCDIQKMVEYFAILFSYTRDYKIEEEKYLKKLKNLFTKEIKEINTAIKKYIEKTKNKENYENYFPLIKLKELIEENQINLKDKYVEFLFYYLKQFDDKNAKLDYLKYSKLNDLLELTEDSQDKNKELSISEEEDKKLNTEPSRPERFDNILKKKNKDNNISNENNEESNKDVINNEENKTDESATEITVDEYLRQLKESIDLIKKAIKIKNSSFKDFVKDKKKITKQKGENVEYISINDLNNKLKAIGVILSDLKLSCLCSKYSLENNLQLINIKNLEQDINSE